MQYEFKWRAELLFALATFAVYVGGAFVAAGDGAMVDSWSDWALATCVAGARAAVAALLTPLAAWAGSRGG